MWFLLTTHILSDIECRISVFAMKTQIINSFNFRCVRNQEVYLFWTPPPLSSLSSHIFCTRPLKITHGFFLDLFTAFWIRSWRNAWNCLFGSRMWAAEGIAGTLISSRVNVIELYIINIWRKIKFNERKVYHQFVCIFFRLLNQH